MKTFLVSSVLHRTFQKTRSRSASEQRARGEAAEDAVAADGEPSTSNAPAVTVEATSASFPARLLACESVNKVNTLSKQEEKVSKSSKRSRVWNAFRLVKDKPQLRVAEPQNVLQSADPQVPQRAQQVPPPDLVRRQQSTQCQSQTNWTEKRRSAPLNLSDYWEQPSPAGQSSRGTYRSQLPSEFSGSGLYCYSPRYQDFHFVRDGDHKLSVYQLDTTTDSSTDSEGGFVDWNLSPNVTRTRADSTSVKRAMVLSTNPSGTNAFDQTGRVMGRRDLRMVSELKSSNLFHDDNVTVGDSYEPSSLPPDSYGPTQQQILALHQRHRKLSLYGTLPRLRPFPRRQRLFHTKDAATGDAGHMQQRLRNLNSDLVTLRSRLHPVTPPGASPTQTQVTPTSPSALTGAGGTLLAAATAAAAVVAAAGPNGDCVLTEDGQLVGHQSAQQPFSSSGPGFHGHDGPTAISHVKGAECGTGTLKAGSSDHLGGTLRHVTPYTAVQDLIHLSGPLTEDAVIKTLQARFYADEYFTNVGPILLAVNPYHDVGNALTLASTRDVVAKPPLLRVVHEAVRLQSETGYPQALILSGCSGSGKTYASMLLLRQLFDVAGGGPETDAFKHLSAAFTVLRSLGSAKTHANSESSRIGHFIEVQVTDGALYRTKIHCYFLDQTRVVKPMPGEKNYHIFYQMLAGLTTDERAKLNLEGYFIHNLRYLNRGDINQNEGEDARRFQAWKACLGVLGIPFLDVVRVLAAVLLLGNIVFSERVSSTSHGRDHNCDASDAEVKAVANLLGITPSALFRGLTTRTHNVKGQLVKSTCDANMCYMARDALAKALYCRTVATIVRRANSLKRLGSGTLSSDSNDSVHNQMEVASQHASTIGTAGSKSSRSMAVLNNAVRHATDGFIGILDMFGFEDPKPSQMEHLCINLCAETMQHFYNTHIFKSSIESCREEGIQCDVEVDYVDNVPCIDLISSLRTGLLSMLDGECALRGTPESYIHKIRVQHKQNPRLIEPKSPDPRTFTIQHFAGRVQYDATEFLDTNRDILPDDLVAVFHKQSCNFGFATHLFGSELKALYTQDTMPRGIRFRISPTSHTDLLNGDDPVSTLTQDFHTRLDNLLRTLVHAKPHFIRCIRANNLENPGCFERGAVMKQVRALQVLETVNLMAGGFPHRMRFKAFNSRYKVLAPFKRLKRADDKASEDCQLILECFQRLNVELPKLSNVSNNWALGKRHIFLSEGARQQLESLRANRRHKAAVLIQSKWRGWHLKTRWPTLKRQLEMRMANRMHTNGNSSGGLSNSNGVGNRSQTQHQGLPRPRPQPIAGTPPPEVLTVDKCDSKTIQQTCSLFGLDLERPPPLPPSRTYTVSGNTRLGYPQTRVMKNTFTGDESNNEPVLRQGETVLVVGASQRRGHLLVEHKNHTLHVPFQYLELRANQPGVPI